MNRFSLILSGLIGGIIVNLPYWSWTQGDIWPWAERFPLSWLGVGMTQMSTFFHEIGHTVLYWFYGYVAVPGFDFTYGGGMAYAVTGQLYPLLAVIDALILYAIYQCRNDWRVMAGLSLLLAFNLGTAFLDTHQAVIAFAGPAGQAVAGAMLLTRLTCGMTENSAAERHAHAIIGCGLIGQVFVEGWNLLHNAEYKQMYDNQKGGHDLGDFAQVMDLLDVSFASVVDAWLAVAAICLIIPVAAGLALQSRLSTRI